MLTMYFRIRFTPNTQIKKNISQNEKFTSHSTFYVFQKWEINISVIVMKYAVLDKEHASRRTLYPQGWN